MLELFYGTERNVSKIRFYLINIFFPRPRPPKPRLNQSLVVNMVIINDKVKDDDECYADNRRNQGWDWRCPKHFGCGGV